MVFDQIRAFQILIALMQKRRTFKQSRHNRNGHRIVPDYLLDIVPLFSDEDSFHKTELASLLKKPCMLSNKLSIPVVDESDYEVCGKLGAGVSSNVFLVRKRGTTLYFAKKQFVLKNNVDNDAFELDCARELSILQKINHQNIIRAHGVMNTDIVKNMSIIFPHYDYDLDKFITDHGPLTNKSLFWKITRQIFSGLAHLHGQNVLHRDLKPKNILIDKNHHVVIADCGMSRFVKTNVTASPVSTTTSPYILPPEHLCSRSIASSKAADVWAAGISCLFLVLPSLIDVLCDTSDDSFLCRSRVGLFFELYDETTVNLLCLKYNLNRSEVENGTGILTSIETIKDEEIRSFFKTVLIASARLRPSASEMLKRCVD